MNKQTKKILEYFQGDKMKEAKKLLLMNRKLEHTKELRAHQQEYTQHVLREKTYKMKE
jgi:hypothetical protein